MIGIYFKGYLQRIVSLLVSIIIFILSVCLPAVIYFSKITNICDQLSSYESADYSKIYVLNYEVTLDNVCVFPDTDIAIYLDSERVHRLTVSSLMNYPNSYYDYHITTCMNELSDNEICLSKNVAVKYGIKKNDILYIVYPYSDDIIPIFVKGIEETNYDITNPVIDNDIGMVFLGFDEKYLENVQSKFFLFSESSDTIELSKYPQIINSIISIDKNKNIIYNQGIDILIWFFIFSLTGVIIVHFLFFRKSRDIIHRIYVKGGSKYTLITLMLIEKIVFCVTPCLLTAFLTKLMFCQVQYTNILFIVSVSASVFYCIASTIVLFAKSIYRRGI